MTCYPHRSGLAKSDAVALVGPKNAIDGGQVAGVKGTSASMDKHSSVLLAAGGVIAAAGGAFMTVTPTKSSASDWTNTWFSAGFACVIIGLCLAALGLFMHFNRQRLKSSAVGAKEATRVPKAGDPGPPLIIKIMPHSWFENWGPCRIAILLVEVENTTDRDISIVRYEFTCDNEGQPHWDHRATNDERMEIVREITRRQNDLDYGPPLEDIKRIAARSRVSGCCLAPVSRNPVGGTPECVLEVEDDMGNRYLAKLPRRKPRTYEAL